MTLSVPPRVPGRPLIGNTLDLLRDPAGFLVGSYRQFGPVFRVSAFGMAYTVMAGREAMQFLTTTGEKHFSRATFYRRFARELGTREFILGAQGARHGQLRRVMKLGFSRQVAEPHIPAMVDGVSKRAREWSAGQRLRVPELMADLAFDAYCLVMAGTPLHEYFREALTYSETIMRVGAKVRPSALLLLPHYLRAKRRVFSLMQRLLEEHRYHREDPEREFDLFYALLDGTSDDGETLADSDIVASALYGFVGTLVYLSRVLGYLLYELLKNPALRDQATREADAVLGAGTVTAQGLRRMNTLQNAYLETLRFHPVALGLPYLAEQDFEFAGRLVRKGARIVLTPLPVHFSSDFYSSPHCFDSGRCAEPRREIHASGAYAPFGFDGRVCAAAGLVEIISLATIAALLHAADLRLQPPGYDIKTVLNPLPGPEKAFAVQVAGLRTPGTAAPALSPVEGLGAATAESGSPQWNELLSRVTTADYEAAALIIREGEAATRFFILQEGTVEVLKRQESGRERILATLGPGDYFGEIGLLRRIPRTASVRARSAVKTLVVDRDTFVEMIAESDLVSEQIAGTIRRRIMAVRLAEALPRLTPDQLARFLPNFSLARYAPGETIVRQGDPSDAFFVIVSGRIEVVKHREGGRDWVLQEMGAGEWFGEIGILLGKPRSATVRAAAGDETEVMRLAQEDFKTLLGESTPTTTDIWGVMSRRLSALKG